MKLGSPGKLKTMTAELIWGDGSGWKKVYLFMNFILFYLKALESRAIELCSSSDTSGTNVMLSKFPSELFQKSH